MERSESFKYFPRVRTSRIRFEHFDSSKIVRSVMRETGLSKDEAERIATVVTDKIQKMRLDFLSAPLIRELVCVALLELGPELSTRG
jgi:ribonucleoside-triphosphate reductase